MYRVAGTSITCDQSIVFASALLKARKSGHCLTTAAHMPLLFKKQNVVMLGLNHCHCRAFTLVGDHHQLPPLVTSRAAEEGGLGISLFKRLCDAHPQVAGSCPVYESAAWPA